MSKTMIAAFVSALLGVLTMLGVTLDAETESAIRNNLEAVIGGILVLYAIVMAIFRKLTDTPLAKGLSGVLGKKETE